MKKIFSLMVAMMAMVAVNATKVTFDFASTDNWTAWGIALPEAGKGTDLNGQSIAQDGVTLSFVKGTGNTTVRLYQGSGNNEGKYDLRLYAGDKMTIAVDEPNKIFALVFDAAVALEGTTETKTEFTFTEGVTSVVISSKANLKSLVVYVNETPTPEQIIDATCAEAQTIGLALEAGASTEQKYAVTGYVVSVLSAVSNNQQSFWIADTEDAELGTIQSYYCSVPTEVNVGDQVKLIGYLTKYVKEGADPIVEIKNGQTEILKSAPKTVLTVSAGSSSYDGDMGEVSFEFTTDKGALVLEGYQSANEKAIAGTYNVEDFWTVSLAGAEFEGVTGSMKIAYVSAGVYDVDLKMVHNAETYVANAKNVNLGVHEEDNNNIDVALALELCKKLNAGEYTDITYNIYGYVVQVNAPGAQGDKRFLMADDMSGATETFLAYNITIAGDIKAGDLVKVSAQLYNYNGTMETRSGKGEIITTIPEDIRHGNPAVLEEVSVTEAVAIGMALNNTESGATKTTEKTYKIHGYCVNVKTAYDEQYKNETWYMADEVGAYGELQAYRCAPDVPVQEGDEVVLIGKISNYCGTSTKEGEEGQLYNNIQVSNGAATNLTRTALWQVEAGTEAIKRIENGQLILERNGVKYSVTGAKL